MDEHLYIVTYDIADEKRWRTVFRIMKGYGEWLQLSVFQCRLSPRRHAELIELLSGAINNRQDHVLLVDIGPAERVTPRVVSLGKNFEAVAKVPVIV
ncbi:CRISPR-associated endonuclease Cas2 [Immundisolibacter sp.]